MRTALSLATRPAVWGDEEADESWSGTVAVDRWALVEPDEYIRFFPALACASGLPAPLLEHLAGTIEALARQCGRSTAPLARAATLDPRTAPPGPERRSAAFSPVRRLFGRRWDDRPEAGPRREEVGLRALDPLLLGLQNGTRPPYTEAGALALAFHGGIHPAYVWPEALACHEVASAAGWLGLVARGRAALMPRDIAQVLAEAIDPESGHLRDDRLAFCGFSGAHWSTIGLAARRRLDGVSACVRLRRP